MVKVSNLIHQIVVVTQADKVHNTFFFVGKQREKQVEEKRTTQHYNGQYPHRYAGREYR